MKKQEQGRKGVIILPRVEKMSHFHQNYEIVSYKPTANIDMTIQKVQQIPGKQSPSLYNYLAQKLNCNNKLYYDEQISNKSLTSKHDYNLKKRLDNLQDVLDIFQELHEQEKYELKDEIKEILRYQSQLMDRYQQYERKLLRLIDLEKECSQQTTKKVSQFLELQKLSKKSKISGLRIQEAPIVQVLLQGEQSQTSKQSGKQIGLQNRIQDTTSFEQLRPNHIDLQNQAKSSHQAEQIQNQIQQKQTERQSLQQQLKNAQLNITEAKKRQDKSRQSVELFVKEKQKTLEQIGSIEKSKLQLQNQTHNLSQSLKSKNLHTAKLQNQQSELKFMNSLITNPIQELYLMKKSLNNQLQQLRGSIRVYCRIRPLKHNQNQMIYELKSHDFIQIKKTLEEKKSQNIKTDFKFVFDRIFDQNTSQKQVFSEISQLIQTAIDGVNVCIFAYGQTGSGKTFTMQGNNEKGKQDIGIIPRSTELIFAELQKYKENGWETALDVSINEIYNDSVVNLLEKSEIKMSKPVFTSTKSIKQVEDLFEKAISNRSTAFTLSNADSSRSHLIFIIRIQSKFPANNKKKSQQRQSQLVLVDLAGSERVKESGVSNERLKQAQHINSSLSYLGQVIRSLKSNKGKTNFRNSKLTYFLEPYLQKGSKAIMFVNISPSVPDESQSINSLKFASTARECKLQAD